MGEAGGGIATELGILLPLGVVIDPRVLVGVPVGVPRPLTLPFGVVRVGLEVLAEVDLASCLGVTPANLFERELAVGVTGLDNRGRAEGVTAE